MKVTLRLRMSAHDAHYAGELVDYNIVVSNTGNETLTNVVILNNLVGATPVFTTATLAPGMTANFTGSYLAPTNSFRTPIWPSNLSRPTNAPKSLLI